MCVVKVKDESNYLIVTFTSLMLVGDSVFSAICTDIIGNYLTFSRLLLLALAATPK